MESPKNPERVQQIMTNDILLHGVVAGGMVLLTAPSVAY